jgi:mannose-6-phosphate isomerase-like protein (cupin superfamily)
MIDVTVKRFEELDSYQGQGVPKGQYAYAGRGLGVTAWGMNLLNLPASWPGYPDHDHAKDGQEEVYIVLDGSARLQADGEDFTLEPGVLARVGPAQKRKIVPGPKGVTLLAIGGTPGKAYAPRS